MALMLFPLQSRTGLRLYRMPASTGRQVVSTWQMCVRIRRIMESAPAYLTLGCISRVIGCTVDLSSWLHRSQIGLWVEPVVATCSSQCSDHHPSMFPSVKSQSRVKRYLSAKMVNVAA